MNFITEKEEEFGIIDVIFTEFEDMSGAILSRSKKTKVLGLGGWRGRNKWPLKWIETVDELKVFGIKVSANYKEIVKLNWEFRLTKLIQTINSWAPRILETLVQRVEILRTFALSRIWYVAAVIPMETKWVKKFEAEVGNWKKFFQR